MTIGTDTEAAVAHGPGPARPEMPADRWPLSLEKRQQFILDNLCEVRRVARRMHAGLPRHVSLDDIVHSGVVGLIDAVDKFDSSKNVSFRFYAHIRIRGAILDNLRDLDGSSRSLRQEARRIEEARSQLIAILGRSPLEAEVAAHIGLGLDKFQRILTQLHSPIAGARQGRLECTSQEEEWVEPTSSTNENPFHLCVRAETIRMLTEAVESLGERERRVLALYYLEERTMKEVGRVLNVHESRISQIISVALNRLRARLREVKVLA
jgi:RNA polymerase sigma factor FliA